MGFDVREAVQITYRLLAALKSVPFDTTAPEAADLRRSLGIITVDAETLIRAAALSDPLAEAFGFALALGGTVERFDRVRKAAIAESPTSVESQGVVSIFVRLSLVHMARAMIRMGFRSRQDVEAMKARMNSAFDPAEEDAADNREADVYRTLVALHAAVIRDLVVSARPLPRMVEYAFARSYPSLRLSQRLYATPERADELRAEGKVPHPLFMPFVGKALSA